MNGTPAACTKSVERYTGSLHKVGQFLCGFRLHGESEHIIVPAFGIEGMIDIHSHSHTAHLNRMVDLAEHLAVISMRLDDLDGSGPCGHDVLQLLVATHAHPMHSTTQGSCTGIDGHPVACGVLQMRQGSCHNRCAEYFAEQRHFG